MNIGKAITMTMVGFFLGLLLLVLSLGGLLMGTAGYAAGEIVRLEPPQGTPLTGEEKDSAISLQDMDLSRGLFLSEKNLERLVGSNLHENLQKKPSPFIQWESVSLDFQENSLECALYFTNLPNDLNFLGKTISRIPTSLGFRADLRSGNEDLSLKLTQFRLGDLSVPTAFYGFLPSSFTDEVAAFGETLPEGITLNPQNLEMTISYRFFNDTLKGLARLRSIKAGEEGLTLFLVMDSGLVEQLSRKAAPLIARDGAKVLRAMKKVLPQGNQALHEKGETLVASLERWGSDTRPDEAYGILSYLEGDVRVFNGQGESVEAMIGQDLEENSLVKTGPRGTAELLLLDGSVVRLSPGTELALKDLPAAEGAGPDRSTTLALAYGSFRAVVEKLDAGASFDTQVASAVMGVRGTDYTVSYDEKKGLEVTVLEGAVEVDPEHSDPLELSFDERVELSCKELSSQYLELKAVPLKADERKAIEESQFIQTDPAEGEALRKQGELAQLIVLVKELAGDFETLSSEEQEELARELEAQIDLSDWEVLIEEWGADSIETLMEEMK